MLALGVPLHAERHRSVAHGALLVADFGDVERAPDAHIAVNAQPRAQARGNPAHCVRVVRASAHGGALAVYAPLHAEPVAIRLGFGRHFGTLRKQLLVQKALYGLREVGPNSKSGRNSKERAEFQRAGRTQKADRVPKKRAGLKKADRIQKKADRIPKSGPNSKKADGIPKSGPRCAVRELRPLVLSGTKRSVRTPVLPTVALYTHRRLPRI